MADTMRLDIVTPQKAVYSDQVEFVLAPAIDGAMGVLPNHAPLVTALNVGILKIKKDNNEIIFAVSGGFLEVKENRVVVLASTAEAANEIDVDRAKAAKERAEQRLQNNSEDIDRARAEIALKKAMNRINAVK